MAALLIRRMSKIQALVADQFRASINIRSFFLKSFLNLTCAIATILMSVIFSLLTDIYSALSRKLELCSVVLQPFSSLFLLFQLLSVICSESVLFGLSGLVLSAALCSQCLSHLQLAIRKSGWRQLTESWHCRLFVQI